MDPDARRPWAAGSGGGGGTPQPTASASDLLQQLRALNHGRGSSKTYAGLAAAGRSSALGQAGAGTRRRRSSPAPGVRVGSASGGGKGMPASAYFVRQGAAEPVAQFAAAHQQQQGTPAAFSQTPPSRPAARVATPDSGASPFADDDLLMFHMTGVHQRVSSRMESQPAAPEAAQQQVLQHAERQRRGLHRTESAPAVGVSPPLSRAFSFAGEPSPRADAVPLPTAMHSRAAGPPESAASGRAPHATLAGRAEVPREAAGTAGGPPIDGAASASARSSPQRAGTAAELVEEAGSGGASGPAPQPPLGPAWPQELLDWMLREKAGLMVEAQRAQRREQELCAELDRLRAQGGGAQREVQRLTAERRALLDRVQALSAAEAEAAARAERLAMENDALAAELRHSQEVCREMLAARRAARDALTEMSGQNASLLAAYVEMKQEAGRLQQALQQQQHHSEARMAQLEAQLAAARTVSLAKPRSPAAHPLPGSSSPIQSAAEQQGSPAPAVASSFGNEQQQQQPLGSEDSEVSEAGVLGGISGSPQTNKENEAGNGGSASAARRTRQADKGRWEEERSELLTLLERLQDQLSARAGQQHASMASPLPCRRGTTPQRGGHGEDGRRAPPPSPWAAAAAASNLEASFDSVSGSGSGSAGEGGWPGEACSPSAGSSGSSGAAMPADDDCASSPAVAAHLVEDSPLPPHSWSRSGAPSPPSTLRAGPGAATSAGPAAAAELGGGVQQGEEQVQRGGAPADGRHTMEAFLGSSPPAGSSLPAASSGALPGSALQAAQTAASEQQQQQEELLAQAQQHAAELEAELDRLRLANAAADARAAQEERRHGAEAAKAAGNAAFQAQRYEEAVQHYSRGLEAVAAVAVPAGGKDDSAGDGSADAALRAVLLCNRAAAQHACSRYLEALADCYRAAELDPGYARAYHRRADAFWALGVYDAAAQDLAHLTKLGAGQEVAGRLGDAQRRAQAAQPPNYYAVLGVKPAATPGEVRAAYRALALRFHPDRAASELGGEAAHAIFKLVSEAHRVLSDAEQRRHHDIAALRHKYRRFYTL